MSRCACFTGATRKFASFGSIRWYASDGSMCRPIWSSAQSRDTRYVKMPAWYPPTLEGAPPPSGFAGDAPPEPLALRGSGGVTKVTRRTRCAASDAALAAQASFRKTLSASSEAAALSGRPVGASTSTCTALTAPSPEASAPSTAERMDGRLSASAPKSSTAAIMPTRVASGSTGGSSAASASAGRAAGGGRSPADWSESSLRMSSLRSAKLDEASEALCGERPSKACVVKTKRSEGNGSRARCTLRSVCVEQ